MFPPEKILSMLKCQAKAAQWRIFPIENSLAVVPGVVDHTVSANLFGWLACWSASAAKCVS